MSNQLIKTTELGKENVFPRTRILDLFDETSGLKLIDILRSFNMMFVSYLGNKSLTRNQISPELRRQGLWLTYVIDNTVYTEWYDEVAIDDTNWGSDSNWRQGSNALVGDLSISPNGTWVINGEDSGIAVKGDKGDSPVIRIYNNKILVSYDKGVTYEDLNNTPVYTKFRFNSLTNTYLVSYDLGGTWLDISDERVYHKFRYNSSTNTYLESIDFGKTWSNISAEKVYYLFRYNAETNTHLVSTDLGLNWTDISSNKVYYQFRTGDNRLLVSTDLGITWENCSEPIAAWFRWVDTSGTGNVGKVLISRDNKTWSDLSPTITNNLYIKGYIAAVGNLPSNAAIGDIYMVGPTYDESDTTLDYPHYRMWVKLSSGWVDNGEYLSNVLISLTTGLETGITMSLKAITAAILAEKNRAEAAELANTTAISEISFSKHIYNGQDFSSGKLSFDSDKLYDLQGNSNYTSIVKEVNKGDVVYVTANGGTYVDNYFCTFVATDKHMNIIYRHDVGSVENQEYVITEDGFIAVLNLIIQGKEPRLIIYTKRDLNILKRQNHNLFDNASSENEDGYIYVNNVKTSAASYFTTHWFNAVGKIKIEGISKQTRIYFLVDGVRKEKLLIPTDNVIEYEIEEQYIGKQVSFYAFKSEKLTLVVTDNSQSSRHLESDILIDESQIVNRVVSPTPIETKSIIESTIYEDYSRERGLIDQSGVLVDNPTAATTEKIFINEGDFIQFALYHIQAYPIISAYDSSNNFISEKSLFVSGYSSGVRGTMVGTYIVPSGVSYIRISTYYAWSSTYRLPEYLRFCVCKHIDVPVYSHNEGVQLNGKKWVAFGTSITDDIFENSVEAPNVTGKYFKHLVHKSGMIATNFGLAGSSIVGRMLNMIKGNPSDEIVGKYYENIVPDADIITIEGFVNDYATNKPIGEITDTGDTTVCGCLYQAISHLRNISNATIVIITDSSGKSDVTDFSINKLNENGLTQSQFNDSIIKMAKHLGCYVIDAGSESGICSLNPRYIVDNIHHTELGGKQFANAIWARLKDVQLMEKTVEVE